MPCNLLGKIPLLRGVVNGKCRWIEMQLATNWVSFNLGPDYSHSIDRWCCGTAKLFSNTLEKDLLIEIAHS